VAQNVYLRPVTEADLPLVERLTKDPDEAGPFAFYGYRDTAHMRRDFAENGLLGPDAGHLAVGVGPRSAGSEFVGAASWHRRQSGPTSYCWNIGIGLLASARGHGYGTAAQRLLAAYLLAHTQVNRVEADTEIDNSAERRSLEKAGFTFEGVVRGSCFRAGAWRDMALYSLLRSDVSPS
jgi:RimJ/RimL family protein N-acetyltransferase